MTWCLKLDVCVANLVDGVDVVVVNKLEKEYEDLKMQHCIISIEELLDIYKYGIDDDPFAREMVLVGALIHPIITAKDLNNEQRLEKITLILMKILHRCEKGLGIEVKDIANNMVKKYGVKDRK